MTYNMPSSCLNLTLTFSFFVLFSLIPIEPLEQALLAVPAYHYPAPVEVQIQAFTSIISKRYLFKTFLYRGSAAIL